MPALARTVSASPKTKSGVFMSPTQENVNSQTGDSAGAARMTAFNFKFLAIRAAPVNVGTKNRAPAMKTFINRVDQAHRAKLK